MDPRETYLRLMVCVARIDGRIADSERRLLEAAAERSGLPEARIAEMRSFLEDPSPFDVDEEVARIGPGLDPGTLLEILRDGYVMASSDKDLAPCELAILDRFMAGAGIREVDRPSLHEWARLAAGNVIDGLLLASTALEHARAGS